MATIGIFDSGSGGLSVLKEIRKVLPSERFIYYSDNMKKELAKMLIDSLNTAMVKAKKTKKKLDACDYAGIWSDEEYMDADELVKVISDGRHVKSSRDDFWETL